MKFRILHNIYEVVCEFGAEMWGLHENWKETDMAQEKFYKKVLKIPTCAINKVAELEMGRESRRVFGSKVLVLG